MRIANNEIEFEDSGWTVSSTSDNRIKVEHDNGEVYYFNDVGELEASSIDVKSVNTEQVNSITWLDANDSDHPNPQDYLTNNLSSGEVVYIAQGTHTGPEAVVTEQCTILWEGTLKAGGDHPTITFDHGANRVKIEPLAWGLVSTPSTYTSNAVNFHGRFEISGVFDVSHYGDVGVNIEQRNSGDNLNHSTGVFRIDGKNSGSVGLMVDNSSGLAPDVNNMRLGTWNARQHTEYGIYLNAGAGNRYTLATGANGGAGFAYYAGGGPRGASGTNNSDNEIWVRSDGSNGSTDEFGNGVANTMVTGSPNGGTNSLGAGVAYRIGPEVRGGTMAFDNGIRIGQTFNDPSTSDLLEGEGMLYVSDGSGDNTGGNPGDLVYAYNDGGNIVTSRLEDRYNMS
jgi:hypothetical protein